MNNQFDLVNKQSGVVLVVCLIMLTLLTMLGLTGMQTTGLEEKMASNMRDRNLAFQAAESALSAGEAYLDSLTSAQRDNLVFNCTNGLFSQPPLPAPGGCAAASFWDNINWDANSIEYPGDDKVLGELSAKPRYVLERLSDVCRDAVGSQIVPGCAAPNKWFRRYRITARATGGSTNSIVMLQTVYEYET